MARGKKVTEDVLEDPKVEYLSRFVKDKDDTVLAESIGVEGKDIVLKNGNTFMIVPLSSLALERDILRVKKKINWKTAKKKGEKWKKKELDPL